ncbi:BPSS1187 family protein [Roseimaritima ulvae]|uniref:DUF4886 domain-containing protein n=1 Tax=Roseimaritima ulvae TaxID=980254 RepID=A0A5B9QK73_9BACT|nr:DUF4886 domain-containing protein [Roseimaritima ulvae]QEG38132.1 hypothetical protein UC8_00850 [Roseimaritima ulvae]
MFKSPLLVALIACSVFGTASAVRAESPDAKEPESPKHVRILTVGNSFTHNATRYLDEIVEAAGHRLTHKMLSIGGSPLKLHAAKAMAFEADRDDESARYGRGESLQQALQSEDWDFVTIQQVSIKSHDVQSYRPYAGQLADIVHRYAPEAKLLMHQTWAYRSDDPRFRRSKPAADEPATQQAMYEGLSKAYRTITAELSAGRIPVGDAFWIADNHPKFGYRAAKDFDASQLESPALPDQTHSLHVGYRWSERNGTPRLGMDGHHANLAGEYLGACVWFECLFGESPVGNSFVPAKLDAEFAAHLQSVAHQAAQQGGDVVHGVVAATQPKFDDPDPQRYQLRVRASEIDPRAKEYPEIGFAFGSDKKPTDLEFASVDTRVAPQGKLAIWLMGHNAGLFERLNEYGIHAIGVHYARGWFGKLAQPKPSDAYARGRIRLEAASGLDISDELDLLPPDGAAERARQLVLWLSKENPQGNWEQFLADDGSRLRWDKIIVTGASHGSTTAARFAKHQRVDRVVMLCGPRDQDQDWQGLPSATPANRFFGFTHVLDGGWTGDHYCRSWELLGLHAFGPIVNIDDAQPPYENSRRLITAADVGGDARRAHSSVTPGGSSPKAADGSLLFDPVWRYLYTHDVDAVGEASEPDPDCQRVHVQYE